MLIGIWATLSFLGGCVERASDAEREVRNASPDAIKQLNLKAVKTSEEVSQLPAGTICEVTGEVKSISIPADPNKEQYHLEVVVSDYQNGTPQSRLVDCTFSDKEGQALKTVKVGETVGVRGKKFSPVGPYPVPKLAWLNGCVLLSRE
jgi:hypothetical protein